MDKTALNAAVARLEKLCTGTAIRVAVMDSATGHIQLQGGTWLVNYYPVSKKQTCYLKGTREGLTMVTPERAVRLAKSGPEIQPEEDRTKRGQSKKYGRWKAWRLTTKAGGVCYLCGKPLTYETATVDHVVPLSRGGMDAPHNWALACHECNAAKGSALPVANATSGR